MADQTSLHAEIVSDFNGHIFVNPSGETNGIAETK